MRHFPGAHSPDAVKKLLALSETKVKTVKNSSSSSSVPLSQLSNSRLLNTSSSSSMAVASGTNAVAATTSAPVQVSSPTPLSPKTKHRSVSSSQPINPTSTVNTLSNNVSNNSNNSSNNKYTLSCESSSVSTIKLNQSSSKYNESVSKKADRNSNGQMKSTVSVGAEADSGRASMASNVDQDQCSPTFQQRAFVLNRCMFLYLKMFILNVI